MPGIRTTAAIFLAFTIGIASCNPVANNKAQADSTVAPDSTKTVDGHPAWIMQGNLYEVNVRQYTKEGTFKAFEKHLDRLRDMGVQTLWFMPINPISKVDRKGKLGSYYAVSSYMEINPEFGNMADWKHLVNTAHEKGFKVIIDWVPNHTGADHPWLESHPDFYVKDSTGKAVSQFDWSDTRKLDYHNPVVADSMIAAMKFWIDSTDIDGYRCDMAFLVGKGLLWPKCIPALKQLKNVLMVAETEDSWLHEEGFDISYPWKFFHATVDIAAGKKSPLYLNTVNALVDSTFPSDALMMYFTSNHDENSWNKADYGTMPGAIHAPFAVLTQTMKRSVPMIYSGQEEPHLDSIRFFYKDPIKFGKFQRAGFYKTLLELRKNNKALSADANFRKVAAGNPNQLYAFVREYEANKILVVLNLSAQEAEVKIDDSSLKGNPSNIFLMNKEDPTAMPWKLEPWGYAVYVY
jgi:alpha-amylase